MNIKKLILKIPGVRGVNNKYKYIKSKKLEKIRCNTVLEDIEHNNTLRHENNRTYKAQYDDEPLVSIIVVNRDGKHDLEKLKASFSSNSFYDRFELIVVDNASTDYAANNIGAKKSKGEYLLFLSNDTEVTEGWLDELLIAMRQTDNTGAVGAKLIYPKMSDDSPNAGKAYSIQHGGIAFNDCIREKSHFITPYNILNGKTDILSNGEFIERIGVSSDALMIKHTVFDEVNGFDERYEYEYGDVDLCLKLHKAGYTNYYCPSCILFHDETDVNCYDADDLKRKKSHDMQVFKGVWQKYLSYRLFDDRLEKKSLFTEKELLVCVLLSDKEKDSNIYELENSIKDLGYKIKILYESDYSENINIGIETDVLIYCNENLDMTKLMKKKNDLVIIDWNEYKEKLASDFVNILKERNKDIINEKEIDICGAMPDNDTKKFWGDQHYAMAMKKEFERCGYKANVLPKDRWYDRSSARYIIVLRGVKPYYVSSLEGRKTFMWNISHPEDVTIDEYNMYDYVFFASKKMKKELENKIIPKSSVLLQCVDEEVMKYKEKEQKEYELLFVGNSRHVYRNILKDLLPTEHKLTVYGRHWEDYPVIKYIVSEYIDNSVVGQAYHDAKILLNDHWKDMREYGIISNRIFDALAVGAFVISDYMPEINEEFEGSVVTYTTPEDLKDKVDYYLEHDEKREELAKKGKKIVLANHTFRNRIEKIISCMEG